MSGSNHIGDLAMPTDSSDLVLRFSHNVVEHLGLKLYQNKPTNVIAELVSNAWDADASKVTVNTSMGEAPRWVSVLDNGHGMSREHLQQMYLVIGKPRRSHAAERSRGNRKLMGRKGIGKLAPFGIARRVDVLTCALEDGELRVHWLYFELAAVLGRTDGEYRPVIVADGVPLTDIPLGADPTESGQVGEWVELVREGGAGGTSVLMTDLSLGRAISDSQLTSSLGQRFTVATGHQFAVAVNGNVATTELLLPEFDFRVPDEGFGAEQIDGREVRFWVGFVKKADWPSDEAGVGVYAHGKIAQDRPFTFGRKGSEIFTRYMFGVVEADWLDELEVDVISTDRTSVNWELDQARQLYDWGQRKVGSWVAAFQAWRAGLEEQDNREVVRAVTRAGEAPKVSQAEEEEIVRLVSQITPAFGKEVEEKKRLVKAVSEAWVQAPMRRLVKDLWTTVGATSDAPPVAFTNAVERLSAHAVPESLNLAVIFAQRAFALTRLHDYVHLGHELDLQRLIQKFPWIIEPDLAVLTANQQLKTLVERAEELGQTPFVRRAVVSGIPEENRPDFVFMSSPEEQQILIVELKSPQVDLTIENRKQLEDYSTWCEAHYPGSEIRSLLVGRVPGVFNVPYQTMKVIPWTEVLSKSRARNLELLAAMLLRTGGTSTGDNRIADAIELGGVEAREMLDRLALAHDEIRDLMQAFHRPESTPSFTAPGE